MIETLKYQWWRTKFYWAMVALLLLSLLIGVSAVSYHNTITPSGIIIHHSAVPPLPDGSPADVKILDQIHERRGYGIFYWGRTYHIGYHYVILPDGTVQQARPEHCRGAHATGYNSYIGICLIGDFSSADNPDGERGLQEPTEAQMRSLIALSRQLIGRYHFPVSHVMRHHDVNPDTDCPGDRFPFSTFVKGIN
jgi:N-acetylmuramoyl-L-alanine amidase